jgi:hypothetical protein
MVFALKTMVDLIVWCELCSCQKDGKGTERMARYLQNYFLGL